MHLPLSDQFDHEVGVTCEKPGSHRNPDLRLKVINTTEDLGLGLGAQRNPWIYMHQTQENSWMKNTQVLASMLDAVLHTQTLSCTLLFLFHCGIHYLVLSLAHTPIVLSLAHIPSLIVTSTHT